MYPGALSPACGVLRPLSAAIASTSAKKNTPATATGTPNRLP